MTSSSPTDRPVPGTGVVVRVVDAGEALDVELRGDLADPTPAAMDAVDDVLRASGVGEHPNLRLIADHPAGHELALPTELARRLRLHRTRDLLQLRRPLPVPTDDPCRDGAPPLDLQPFDPAVHAEAWLQTNNDAFATHPDQGGQTLEGLTAELAEPWVDLAGFLVAEDPEDRHRLIGSCWTKVHPATATDPALGEIYVIGVDPRHHGRGLGRTLVLAGLDHLAARGPSVGMLYVEADNHPALRLYERLGFSPHLLHRICSR